MLKEIVCVLPAIPTGVNLMTLTMRKHSPLTGSSSALSIMALFYSPALDVAPLSDRLGTVLVRQLESL